MLHMDLIWTRSPSSFRSVATRSQCGPPTSIPLDWTQEPSILNIPAWNIILILTLTIIPFLNLNFNCNIDTDVNRNVTHSHNPNPNLDWSLPFGNHSHNPNTNSNCVNWSHNCSPKYNMNPNHVLNSNIIYNLKSGPKSEAPLGLTASETEKHETSSCGPVESKGLKIHFVYSCLDKWTDFTATAFQNVAGPVVAIGCFEKQTTLCLDLPQIALTLLVS